MEKINIAKTLGVTDNSKDTPKSEKASGAKYAFVQITRDRANSAKNRKEKYSEEEKKKEYAREVLSRDEASTRSASTSSFRAKNVALQTKKTIRATKAAIDTFDNEVKAFDDEMEKIIQRETERIELEEKIAANAGQSLDYFLPQASLNAPRKGLSRQASAASAGSPSPRKTGQDFSNFSSIKITKL